MTILGADAARGDLFRVAGGADVIVAGLGVGDFTHAREAVISLVGGRDRAVADVAGCVEDQRFEIADAHHAWACENSS